MRRREFVIALGLAMLGTPMSAGAQGSSPKRVGVILQGGPYYAGMDGLREGLKAAGLEVGKQIELLLRDARGDPATAAAAARELEREGVAVIVAFTTTIARAAKGATARVPIVFAAGSDPVAFELVDSIAKPGGRLTGVHFITAELTAKRLELLKEIVPTLHRIVTFYNPENPAAAFAMTTLRSTATLLGIDLIERQVTSLESIRERLRALDAGEADAYFFVTDSLVNSHGALIVEATKALRMPVMAYELDLVAKGALAGYGLNYREVGRLTARYVARVLSGTPPGDLPVEAVSRPALAINLKAARALGLDLPQSILDRADEVIE